MCTINRGFVAEDGRCLVVRSWNIVCRSEVCTAKSVDIRFAQQILGSEVCVCDPRIIVQSSDPRFAQQNPWMVQIRTLHIAYKHTMCTPYIPGIYLGRGTFAPPR